MKHSILVLAVISLFLSLTLKPQNLTSSREDVIAITPKWVGERFADGRPKVKDNMLTRMKKISLEQAWRTIYSSTFGREGSLNGRAGAAEG